MKRAILIVDHGSRQLEANELLERVARMVQSQVGDDIIVRHAHMVLGEPTIAQAFHACLAWGAEEVIVHPYMLAPGRHATVDIPRMVKEAAEGHPGVSYRVTEPLGIDPLLGELVLARCGLAPAQGKPHRTS